MASFGLLASLSTLAFAHHSHASLLPTHSHDRRSLPANWTPYGCWTDNGGPRTLSSASYTDTTGMTVESCVNFCSTGSNSYIYAGVEYGQECYCGNSFAAGATNVSLSGCNMPCTGNPSEYCGAGYLLDVYWSGATPPTGPITVKSVGNWTSLGCYNDSTSTRALSSGATVANGVTIESCTSACYNAGYSLAGAEYASQCYCGSTLQYGSAPTPLTDCDMTCTGNSSEYCGGPDRLNVYNYTGTLPSTTSTSTTASSVVQISDLPTSWQYQGCLAEPSNGRLFPYQFDWTTNNTVDACLTQCGAYGYTAAGLEYGEQCFCGDITDVTTNGGTNASATDCNMPCSGDPAHICGGPNRLTTYYHTGPPMNVWNTPSNIGYYEFLIPGVVVPLIATVGINNKVSFLEKSGTSEFSNSTGAYELDLSLVNDFSLAWREMHVKTDVFCAASLVLPDKGARQLDVGGWSSPSTFGVRLYTPDGSPGVNGTNDWQENLNEVSLQQGRWYPTPMVMSNGSILVVGGEGGSNGVPVPTLEILPRPPGGNTTVYLDYMQRTDPNNLYPFLMVLPSGRIFIGYYNEARLLDPVTFDTVVELPNMPGAVNNFLAGRTYPMEGTAVLLPQYAPYTDPIEVLICGGSTLGAAIALDNCISIAPEGTNPTWTIERMPSKRVMPCMVTLPDGTYMILNGAHQGVAGFGLATDPNLGALLYDPSQPIGQRMSILGTTTIARLYHSEATLLPDGRVLVSGSDPQTNYPNGTAIYPQEMRIEVYIPPYLNQGYKQPAFTITETDWQYGGQYQITVTLYQGMTSNMRVSLLAATSNTHGNVMNGGRIIFPEFSCSGNTCTITAPPNAYVSPPSWHQLFVLDGPTPSHSAWVRIGGDPAKLGNWPDFPDFTLPGV